MSWRDEAAIIIHAATKSLPEATSLADRIKIVDAAKPSGWRFASWPQKAWQAARRDYLVRHGYQPKTKAVQRQLAEGLPLFLATTQEGEA